MLLAILVVRGKRARAQLPFSGSRIAVLLTGQAFRDAKDGNSERKARYCVNASFEAQHVASRSLLSNVIEPLEAHGATVEVLLTFVSCKNSELNHFFLPTLKAWFEGRVVAHRLVHGIRDVGHSWQVAYVLLKAHLGKQVGSFDFVFSVRHDMELLHNILHFPANFSKLLFLSERGSHEGVRVHCDPWRAACQPKVDDKLLWVPHALLPAVLDVLEHEADVENADDNLFIPHYFIERFITVPHAALTKVYHGYGLTKLPCGSQADLVPQHLLADMGDVGLLGHCAPSFFRFAPHRG